MTRTDPILDIITALNSSSDLRLIFNGSSTSTAVFCYPEINNNISKGIIYQHYVFSDDKIKQQIRLMLRIICDNLSDAYAAERAVQNTIITFGDEPFNNIILSVKLNGGGQLFDPDTKQYHRIAYFDIIAKT